MKSRLLAVVILLNFGSYVGQAVEVAAPASTGIKPPFGLQWDESAQRIEELLKNAKAEILERKSEAGEEVIAVRIANSGVRQTHFHFREGKLKGVTLSYFRPDWDASEYGNFYEQTAQRLSKRHGAAEETLPPPAGVVAPHEKLWHDGQARLILKLAEAGQDGGEAVGKLRIEVIYTAG